MLPLLNSKLAKTSQKSLLATSVLFVCGVNYKNNSLENFFHAPKGFNTEMVWKSFMIPRVQCTSPGGVKGDSRWRDFREPTCGPTPLSFDYR